MSVNHFLGNKKACLEPQVRFKQAFSIYMVPKAGLEPAQYCYRRILSPLRLPIPPLGDVPTNYKT